MLWLGEGSPAQEFRDRVVETGHRDACRRSLGGCYEEWKNAELSDDWHRLENTCVREILQDLQILFPDQLELMPLGRGALGGKIRAARLTNGIKDGSLIDNRKWIRMVASQTEDRLSPW